MILECRCRTDGADNWPKCRCRTNCFLSILANTYGLSTLHNQADMDVQGVFLSTNSSMDCRMYSCPPPVWTCRMSPRHEQYGRAGCLSTSSSKDVQGVSPPTVVWTCRVSLHHQQYGRAECHSTTGSTWRHAGWLCTTSSVDAQGVFPPQAVWTWMVFSFQPSYSFCKCRTVRHPVLPVSEWKTMQMPEPVRYGTVTMWPTPVLECSGTGLRCRLTECWCRRHQPWCRFPAKHDKYIPFYWQVLASYFCRALAFKTKLCLKYCNQFRK